MGKRLTRQEVLDYIGISYSEADPNRRATTTYLDTINSAEQGIYSLNTEPLERIEELDITSLPYIQFTRPNNSEPFTSKNTIDFGDGGFIRLNDGSVITLSGVVALGDYSELLVGDVLITINTRSVMLSNTGITNINLEGLIRYEDSGLYLYLNELPISSIDLNPISSLTQLTKFTLTTGLGNIGSIDYSPLSSLVNLNQLILDGSEGVFSSIDLTFLNSITSLEDLRLYYSDNTIPTLDLSPLSSLVNLSSFNIYFNNNTISTLDLNPLSSLVNLSTFNISFAYNTISTLDLNPLSSLVNLSSFNLLFSNNTISTLDLNPLSSLTQVSNTTFNVRSNSIDTLDLSTVPFISRIECRYNGLIYLNISNTEISSITQETNASPQTTSIYNSIYEQTSIKDFICENSNSITSIDLTSNTGLETITISNNSNLTEVIYPTNWTGSTVWS